MHSTQSIVEHTQPCQSPSSALEDPFLIDAIASHVERHVGPIIAMFHEQASRYVHVDVHVVGPGPNRPHITLVTSGMSASPMWVLEGERFELRYAELVMFLPADWPLNLHHVGPDAPPLLAPEDAWPITCLGELARLPHAYDTWLAHGHTVSCATAPETLPGTPFSSVLLLPPMATPAGFERLELGPHKTVEFFAVWPLYEDEIRYKLALGLDALLDRFDMEQVDEVVDSGRPCCAGPLHRDDLKVIH
jgi:hypothetical protein